MSIFKAYDIRGIYGTDLDAALARDIARAFAVYLNAERVVVGRDMRVHSTPLHDAVIRGLIRQGVAVTDIGLVSTPMCYFANGTLGVDGSMMITASHNGAEWNGLKLCREGAIPLQGRGGAARETSSDIGAIRHLVEQHAFPPAGRRGSCTAYDIGPAYARLLCGLCEFAGRPRVVADFANAMGSIEIAGIRDRFDLVPLFENLDGTFPNHPANPLQQANLATLCRAVRDAGAAFGVAFDGDADRCGFVDELGVPVNMDQIVALIAGAVLERGPATILHDLRSSWAVRDFIRDHGGTPVMCRVGHAFMKHRMRETGAAFGGELAGHYYFRENFTAESSALAMILIANILSRTGRSLSELAAPLRRLFNSGEINADLPDPRAADAVLARLRDTYSDACLFELDGLSGEYADWWFNVRPSNTEPKLRVIVEARTRTRMEQERTRLLRLISG